jgi:hypothetical protein
MKIKSPLETCLAISGSIEQLKALFEPLKLLGYNEYQITPDWYCRPYLITRFSSEPDFIGEFTNLDNEVGDYEYALKVSAENTDLVLGLAAMISEVSDTHKGEWYKYIGETDGKRFVNNNLYKLSKSSLDDEFAFKDEGNNNNGYYPYNKDYFIKATAEEICNHFDCKIINNCVIKYPALGAVRSASFITVNLGLSKEVENENKTMNKEIIGYKVKEGVNKEAALNLLAPCQGTMYLEGTDANISIGSDACKSAIQLGVLDQLFEPVYKYDKTIVTLRSSNKGEFKIEVTNKGIYYAPDSKYLNVGELKALINKCDKVVEYAIPNTTERSSAWDNHYTFSHKITHIDSGCMKDVPIEDWKKVLVEFEKLNGAIK